MEKKQALEILKSVVDAAIKRGLFENVESVTAVNTALLVLNEDVKENDAQ
jgi:ribosomal protein L7Ae-like RNA K-turn-binding protein